MSYFSHKFTIMSTTGINKLEVNTVTLVSIQASTKDRTGRATEHLLAPASLWQRQPSAFVRKDWRMLVNL